MNMTWKSLGTGRKGGTPIKNDQFPVGARNFHRVIISTEWKGTLLCGDGFKSERTLDAPTIALDHREEKNPPIVNNRDSSPPPSLLRPSRLYTSLTQQQTKQHKEKRFPPSLLYECKQVLTSCTWRLVLNHWSFSNSQAGVEGYHLPLSTIWAQRGPSEWHWNLSDDWCDHMSTPVEMDTVVSCMHPKHEMLTATL